MRWKPVAGIAVAVVLVVVLVSFARRWLPGRGSSTPQTRAPIILRRGNGPEPESLDPHAARSESALTILRDLDEGITAVGADGAPVLAAADHVELSADGRVYRFHLRSNARWSNGDAVVAEDFASAWRRLVDPHTGARYADILSPVSGAIAIMRGQAAAATLGVHAADPTTLVVQLVDPTPYFLGILAHPATFPINRRSLQAQGRAFTKPGVMVSNGAFVLTRWDFGSHLVAARNPRYWNDRATRLDGVEYYSFADGDTELAAFRTGQVDVAARLPAARFEWIAAHLAAQLHVSPQLAVYYLGLNLTKPPFRAAPALRQALSLVIDRQRLVKSITRGGEAAAYTFVPAAVANYTPPVPEYASWPMSKRVARARELLEEAGLARNPPVLQLTYNSNELHNRIAIAVAAMWKDALNIDTTLRNEEFKVLLQDIERGDASLFRASWVGDYDDAYGFLQVLRTGFGINMPHYSNPAYDELLQRATLTQDVGRRRLLLQDAETSMLDDQPVIPLFFYVSKHLVAADIDGWQDNVLDVVYSKNLSKTHAAGG